MVVDGSVALPYRVVVAKSCGRSTMTMPVCPGPSGCWDVVDGSLTLPYRIVVTILCGRTIMTDPASPGLLGL